MAPEDSKASRPPTAFALAIIVVLVAATLIPCQRGFSYSVQVDPRDVRCEELITETGRNLQWQSTVEIENCDRLNRIARIAGFYSAEDQPEFYLQRIPSNKLPPNIAVDVPLLRIVFPQRMFFDTSSSNLRPEAREVIAIIADSLRKDIPDVTLFVAGHTDPRGSWQFNQNLSIDRANTVAQEIAREGVPLASIWRIGFGSDMPLVPNTDEKGMAINRRVEFLISGRTEAVATWLADMQLDNLCSGTTQLETDKCKQELDFRDSYIAVSVTPETAESDPTISLGEQLNPDALGEAKVDPHNTSDPDASAFHPVKESGKTLLLTSPRTIIINPTNRTATPSNGMREKP